MNREDAARRLGVAGHQVVDLVEHPGSHVATLRSGRRVLIGPTAARRYVSEVDDQPGPISTVAAESGLEPAAGQAKEPSARRPPAETAAIREWAKSAGYELADKGRIPAEVVAAYNAAHAAAGEVPNGQSQD